MPDLYNDQYGFLNLDFSTNNTLAVNFYINNEDNSNNNIQRNINPKQ